MAEMVVPARLSFGRFAVLFVVLLAVAAVPLFLTELPPLLDYPNHLSRMYLLPSLPADDLRQFYTVAWAPLANLGMDGVVPFLAKIMPLEWAGKVFLLMIFAFTAGGTAAIHRVLYGRWSLWTCLGFLLLYTRLLLWGFVAFLFGCGLALMAFALWIAMRDRHWALRIVVGGICALLIYLSHLLAFGIYAVMIAGYEFGQVWLQRKKVSTAIGDLAVGGLPFLPALALMMMNSSTGRIIFANPLRKFDLLFSVFDNYSRPFDVTCFVLVVLAVGYAYARRWVKLSPAMIGPMIALLWIYIAMPTQLFTAAGVDRRIPMMIFLALIGGSSWQAPFARFETRFMAAMALMLLVRMAFIGVIWHQAGTLYAGLLRGMDSLPRSSCVAVASGKDGIQVARAPLTHFPTVAIARRDAFVTTVFAYPTQQPIALMPKAKRLTDLLGPDELWYAYVDDATPLSAEAKSALVECGYVAFAGTKAFTLKNQTGLEPFFVTPRLQIYHVAR